MLSDLGHHAGATHFVRFVAAALYHQLAFYFIHFGFSERSAAMWPVS